MAFGNDLKRRGEGGAGEKRCCLGNYEIRDQITHSCIMDRERDTKRNSGGIQPVRTTSVVAQAENGLLEAAPTQRTS